jgi:selenide,water dikinase
LDPRILAGTAANEDAVVYDLGSEKCLISTTDFFLPVVSDCYDFGRIAAANAISDIYAMGGTPLVALAILGWPVQKISLEFASRVMEGATEVCSAAGIVIAGGHSIETTDPVFGLCVNGTVNRQNILTNSGSRGGDLIYMTKKIGYGILSSGMKRGMLNRETVAQICEEMAQLNQLGEKLSGSGWITAMTDITGFGLLGHLHEMAKGADLSAGIQKAAIPIHAAAMQLAQSFVYPDITTRNFNAFKETTQGMEGLEFLFYCDPQTSGGLLMSVKPECATEFEQYCKGHSSGPGLPVRIGEWLPKSKAGVVFY